MPIPADHTTPDIRLDPAGRLAANLPCGQCGYNLRGLEAASDCPECGLSISRTLDDADPVYLVPWLTRMGWAASCCAIAVGVMVCYCTIGEPYRRFPRTFLLAISRFREYEPVASCIVATMYIAFAAAAILSTSRSPGRLERLQRPWVRRSGRCIALGWVVAGFLIQAGGILNSRFLRSDYFFWPFVAFAPIGTLLLTCRFYFVARQMEWRAMRVVMVGLLLMLAVLGGSLVIVVASLLLVFREEWSGKLLSPAIRLSAAWFVLALPTTLWYAWRCFHTARRLRRSSLAGPEAGHNE